MKLSTIGCDAGKPWKTIILLFIAILVEFMVASSSASYLPATIHFFGVPWQKVGTYVGVVNGASEVARGVFSILAAHLIKRIGTKKSFIGMNACLGVFTILYGFSTNVESLIVLRLFIGALSSVYLCSVLLAYDICDEENQTFILTWVITSSGSFGAILGPSVGGYLAIPTLQYEGSVLDHWVLEKFPIIIPNLFLGVIMLGIAYWSSVALPDSSQKTKQPSEYNILINPESHSYSSYRTFENSAPLTTIYEDCPMIENHNLYENQQLDSVVSKNCFTKCSSESDVIEVPFWRERDFLLATSASCLYGIYGNGGTSFVSLWLETPQERSGAGFEPRDTALVLLTTGIIQLLFEVFVIGALNKKLRAKRSFHFYTLINIFLVSNLVLFGKIIDKTRFSVSFTIMYGVMRSVDSGSWTSVYIFLQNSVSSTKVTVAMGYATAIRRWVEGLSYLAIGSIYSHSLEYEAKHLNELKRGFPLNHHLAFYIFSVTLLASCCVTIFIRDDIDIKPE